jgi:hypothetical protein
MISSSGKPDSGKNSLSTRTRLPKPAWMNSKEPWNSEIKPERTRPKSEINNKLKPEWKTCSLANVNKPN